MDNNKKAARLGTRTAQNNAIDKPHSTKAAPPLALHVALMALAALLIVGAGHA